LPKAYGAGLRFLRFLAVSQRRFFPTEPVFDLFRNTRADRGQIDVRTSAPGLHHRSDRRRSIPAGPQLVAVENDERLPASNARSEAASLASRTPLRRNAFTRRARSSWPEANIRLTPLGIPTFAVHGHFTLDRSAPAKGLKTRASRLHAAPWTKAKRLVGVLHRSQ
jgi:hypothetical protein